MFYAHFADEKTEAWGYYVTTARSQVIEFIFEPRKFSLRTKTHNPSAQFCSTLITQLIN